MSEADTIREDTTLVQGVIDNLSARGDAFTDCAGNKCRQANCEACNLEPIAAPERSDADAAFARILDRLTALERRAEQAEREVAKRDVEWRALLSDFDALRARAEQAEAALTKLRNVADQHIADALGPVDEAFVFDVAYAATLAATTPGEPLDDRKGEQMSNEGPHETREPKTLEQSVRDLAVRVERLEHDHRHGHAPSTGIHDAPGYGGSR